MRAMVSVLFLCLAFAVHAVERWGVFEITLTGPASGNPYLDVACTGNFTQGERSVTVPGFWDGGGTYRIRFSPPTLGEWRYETRSATPELNGQTGTFTAQPPTGNNHGPVEVFQTFYLRYADGSPYHQFGTTCYAWTHQPAALQEQTLKTLAGSPFNKLRFCVFPKSYTYNRNEPERFAFQRGADGKFDFSRPDPAFWQAFERRILDLQQLGIEADLILWHPYDRWGFAEMGRAADDRYLRYCVARLGALRNVWWSLANEFDLMAPGAMAGHRGDKTPADWDRFFQILQREDAHQRLRGIHNCRGFYDHTRPWVTHASLQTTDLNGGVRFRRQFGKPVVYDECRYEGDVPQGWGNLTAREMTRLFWLGTLGGCYVGHGETYQDPGEILWWSKGGVLHGQSPARIQWLKDFLAQSPPFHELQPRGNDQGSFLLAKPGEFYLLYAADERPQPIALAGTRDYKLDLVDPWEMSITPLGSVPPGDFAATAPRGDVVLRFTPYAPGEAPRPVAQITASVTAGAPPLTVRFASGGAARAHWDFGDGTASHEAAPAHTYTAPGLYAVTLTVTNAAGASARTWQPIAVDRGADQPLLRAGFATGTTPAWQPQGTARLGSDGGLRLPEGAPWGWVEGGEAGAQELRGLRSFTITGWLKPDSLRVGSGGNRILCCLGANRSGIDLVCLSDGRLRLAVNEWPDGVRNESAAGRLQVGKWTRFAVTYDGTRTAENVNWYFSPPQDAPDSAPLMLDRKASYPAGPVGVGVGGLTLGNFNATMRPHGLDRQFRGEIRELEVFGSRSGGRGAWTLEALEHRGK